MATLGAISVDTGILARDAVYRRLEGSLLALLAERKQYEEALQSLKAELSSLQGSLHTLQDEVVLLQRTGKRPQGDQGQGNKQRPLSPVLLVVIGFLVLCAILTLVQMSWENGIAYGFGYAMAGAFAQSLLLLPGTIIVIVLLRKFRVIPLGSRGERKWVRDRIGELETEIERVQANLGQRQAEVERMELHRGELDANIERVQGQMAKIKAEIDNLTEEL